MPMTERRRGLPPTSVQLRAQLNQAQLSMVRELEYFGWELRFVRRRMYQPSLPVLFAGDDAFLCLREDGTMDETRSIGIRGSQLHH